MKKHILDLEVVEVLHPHPRYVLLKVSSPEPLPEIRPGQFAELRCDRSKTSFLRRPISINFVDYDLNQIWFLVAIAGDGTRGLSELGKGDILNAVLPLGNGFTIPENTGCRILLVGGGVGTAPLLYFGKCLNEKGIRPSFLLGGKTAKDVLQTEIFSEYGDVYITTEDASLGEKGFVTQHSILSGKRFDFISCCGPKPMMVSVARYAKGAGISCEVSLENRMACGLGACLCCVESTKDGNVCVCKEGPVFNIDRLSWQI